MLAIPPKMQRAIDDGNFQPVVYAEITTDYIDIPRDQQDQFTDGTSNINNMNLKNVILKQPALPGDFRETEVLARQGFKDQRVGAGFGHVSSEIPILRNFAFTSVPIIVNSAHGLQTFSLGDADNQAVRLRSIKVTLAKAHSNITLWTVHANVFLVNNSGVLVGIGGEELTTISSVVFGTGAGSATNSIPIASVPTSPSSPSDFTFNFDVDLTAGRRYALVLFFKKKAGAVSTRLPGLFWYGSDININPGEFGYGTNLSVGTGDLSLQVDMAAFSYDGTTKPWVEYRMDALSVMVNEGVWQFEDIRPVFINVITKGRVVTDIKYQAWTANASWTKLILLGTVVDGDTITALSRRYIVRAELVTDKTTGVDAKGNPTGTFIRTPAVKKINAIFPTIFSVSSHPLPFSSVPAIGKSPVIATKVSARNQLTERGSFSLNLIDIDGRVTEALKGQNILNLPVETRYGHLLTATSKNDLLPMALGSVIDYSYKEGMVTLIVQDKTKDLNVKIPRPSAIVENDQTSGKIQVIRKDYKNRELVDVISDIISNEARILPRFIETPSFDLVQSALKGDDSKSLWITHRAIEKSEEAKNLIDDILQVIGAFLYATEQGKLRLVKFPKSGLSVRTWDENILMLDDSQPSGFAKTVINQVLVTVDSSGEGNIDTITGFVDPDAQDDWSPGSGRFVGDRTIKTKWLGPEVPFNGTTLSTAIGRRIVLAHKDGRVPYTCKTVGFTEAAVEVGDLVDITSPVFLKKFNLGSKARQFMVISKDPRIDSGVIAFTLQESITDNLIPTAIPLVEISSFPGSLSAGATTGTVATGEGLKFSVNDQILIGAEVKVLTIDSVSGDVLTFSDELGVGIVSVQSAGAKAYSNGLKAGLPTLVVNVNGAGSVDPDGTITLYEWDGDYDGVNFQVEQTGVTASFSYDSTRTGIKIIALRVTDNNLATNLRYIKVIVQKAPVAIINYTISPSNQPLTVALSSASVGETGSIVKTEWDLSYNGTTFNSEVSGQETVVNLPHQTIRIALKVTDEDGLTNQTDLIIDGKTLAPENVTGFFVDQLGDKLSYTWDVVGDADRDAYEIRKGPTWDSSVLIAKEILTNHFIDQAPLKAGVHVYLIKAINTSGR